MPPPAPLQARLPLAITAAPHNWAIPNPNTRSTPTSATHPAKAPVPTPTKTHINTSNSNPLLHRTIHIVYDAQYADPKDQQDLVVPLQLLAGPQAKVHTWVLTNDNAEQLGRDLGRQIREHDPTAVVVLHADAPPETPAGGQFTALRTLLAIGQFPQVMGHLPAYCEQTLHKSTMNTLFHAHQVPHADSLTVSTAADIDSPTLADFASRLFSTGAQLFLKVDSGFNSAGLTNACIASTLAQLRTCAHALVAQYGAVVVQRYLSGREFTVAVSSTPVGPHVYHPVERVFAPGQLFSPPNGTPGEQLVDGEREPDLVRECQRVTRAAWDAVGGPAALGAWGRADVRCDAAGKVHVLELNNTASFAPNSYFAMSAAHVGWSREDVVREAARVAAEVGRWTEVSNKDKDKEMPGQGM